MKPLSALREIRDRLENAGDQPEDEPPPEPEPDCPQCGDALWVRRARDLEDPRFGRAQLCECVETEAEDVRRERLTRVGGMGGLVRFRLDGYQDGGSDALARCREYAAQPAGWLVLCGPSGSGKTHLAAGIANARIDAGEPALFLVVPDLLDRLRAAYGPGADEPRFDVVFEHVRSEHLLVLDDLDAVAPTGWAREKLFQLLNARYNDALPTVVTCHELPGELDDRLAMRLLEGDVLRTSPPPRPGYRQIGGMTEDRLRRFTFQSFDPYPKKASREEQETLVAASRAMRQWAAAPEGWVVLIGDNGCGKTHLAAATAQAVGGDVFFAVVPDLLDRLRAAYGPGADAEFDTVFDEVRTARLLVLDDLGAIHTTDWAMEKLFQIVNYRTATGLPTVVTTDLPVRTLRERYRRLAVRMLDPQNGRLVAILAGSYGTP